MHVKELQEGLQYNGMLDLYVPTERSLSIRHALKPIGKGLWDSIEGWSPVEAFLT